ncbi:hypothetical protein DK880_00354 [Candidatus Cardinium hertigii]|uniref:Uncharacterized protein n=1 Tax=Candidatus Cardinium hertigii TaxID=247481 RepID=A0A2Z3LBX4_9BACT|nr:hypothetical protein DK880_00354 [Candidatus Cardinium hertigii]
MLSLINTTIIYLSWIKASVVTVAFFRIIFVYFISFRTSSKANHQLFPFIFNLVFHIDRAMLIILYLSSILSIGNIIINFYSFSKNVQLFSLFLRLSKFYFNVLLFFNSVRILFLKYYHGYPNLVASMPHKFEIECMLISKLNLGKNQNILQSMHPNTKCAPNSVRMFALKCKEAL